MRRAAPCHRQRCGGHWQRRLQASTATPSWGTPSSATNSTRTSGHAAGSRLFDHPAQLATQLRCSRAQRSHRRLPWWSGRETGPAAHLQSCCRGCRPLSRKRSRRRLLRQWKQVGCWGAVAACDVAWCCRCLFRAKQRAPQGASGRFRWLQHHDWSLCTAPCLAPPSAGRLGACKEVVRSVLAQMDSVPAGVRRVALFYLLDAVLAVSWHHQP